LASNFETETHPSDDFDFLDEIVETTRKGIEGLWVFPGALVSHPTHGTGIVRGHVFIGTGHGKTMVTEVEWVDHDPVKVTRGLETEITLLESSRPVRGLPTLQPWVTRAR
jgi:hypothetical protein